MSSIDERAVWDAAIVGAGPAGASCAIWLKLLGFQPIVIDSRPQPGGRLADSPYDNPWIVTARSNATGLLLSGDIAANLADRAVSLRLGISVDEISRTPSAFVLRLGDGGTVASHTLVVASGLAAVTGGLDPATGVFFGPGQAVFDLGVHGKSVAVLGGGDNAFDHAALLRQRGAARVRIFARSIRARPALVSAAGEAEVTIGGYEVNTSARRINGEPFDLLLVMYGFQPMLPRLRGLAPRRNEAGYMVTDWSSAETSETGLYAIGDVAGRGHPSVPTALADGVTAAKAIEARLIRKP
ncbi:oxidoreductase [Agaricicola taiwanensis]|uniref:Thioredoxin reductase n=1 Tax=Agaricicola taiwanensis TaxID=591372 RepID=A0A8J2YEY5_9RHOB|nr:NAD(P)/FAD-dependent oxidoreductase [Agaricicola taiwanensis]GGE29932.1 oxidoreductase [Agaricicola taiwanensis]